MIRSTFLAVCLACLLWAFPTAEVEASSTVGAMPRQALDFELSDGRQFVRFADLPAAVTVVNFWRSDCPPCVRELPVLARFARRHSLRVVTIALQAESDTFSAPGLVQDALRPPLVALQGPREPRGLLSRFGNPSGSLPYTLILDAGRQACARRLGEIDAAWLETEAGKCGWREGPPSPSSGSVADRPLQKRLAP